MPIKLEITAETPAEFVSQLAGMLGVRTLAQPPSPATDSKPVQAQVATDDPGPKETTAAPKRTRKPAQTGGGMPDEKQEEVESLETATIEQVKESLLKFVDREGGSETDEAIPSTILSEFGVKKISELKPAAYAKVIARAQEELAKLIDK